MHLAGGDDRKARQIAVVIEQQMQLDRPLGGAEFRPIVHREAQIDHGGIQTYQLVLEAELLPASASGERQLRLKASVEQVEDVLLSIA